MQGATTIETSIISGLMLIFYIVTGKQLNVDTWVMLTYPLVVSFIWAYNNIITLKIYNEQHNYRSELNSNVWYLYVIKAFKLTYVALILSILHHIANLDTYIQLFEFVRLDIIYILLFTCIILAVNKPYNITKIK